MGAKKCKAFLLQGSSVYTDNHAVLPWLCSNWDTPLTEILGAHCQFSDPVRTQQVCLRDVLAHKVGIELGETDFGYITGNFDRDEIVRYATNQYFMLSKMLSFQCLVLERSFVVKLMKLSGVGKISILCSQKYLLWLFGTRKHHCSPCGEQIKYEHVCQIDEIVWYVKNLYFTLLKTFSHCNVC